LKRKILGAFVILIALGSIITYLLTQYTLSRGVRAGKLVKLSETGILIKTYEGTLDLGSGDELTWQFSIHDSDLGEELAKQTAKATNDITKKIETIQNDSKNAVSAIGEISEAIEKINGYAGNIAASVEEQAATTNEVTRIVTEAAEGVKQINENIGQVSEAASVTGKDASNTQDAAKNLGSIATGLKAHVAKLNV